MTLAAPTNTSTARPDEHFRSKRCISATPFEKIERSRTRAGPKKRCAAGGGRKTKVALRARDSQRAGSYVAVQSPAPSRQRVSANKWRAARVNRPVRGALETPTKAV